MDVSCIFFPRQVRTSVKEKEEAKAEYDEAVRHQRTAFLAEETKPDIFEIKVGHLKPGAAAKITLRYLTELPVAEGDDDKSKKGGVRLTVPTTVAPRYVPPTDDSEAAKKISAIPHTWSSPVPMHFELEALTKGKVAAVRSPSHKLTKPELSQKEGRHSARCSLEGGSAGLDRDLVVVVESEDPHAPAVFLEADAEKGTSAAMVSLVPSFSLKEQKCEIVFLVDRSGSMGGSSMEQAKQALTLFVHSLPASCLFNIYSFGSR